MALLAAKGKQVFANLRQRFSPEHLWSDHKVQAVKRRAVQSLPFPFETVRKSPGARDRNQISFKVSIA
jgi:hypothetical protein